jgi:hypothetical protein
MTNTPGEFDPSRSPKRSAMRVRHFAKSMPTEREIAQKAFPTSRERLKAERLAREAAGPPVAAEKTKPKKKVK